MVKTDDGNDGLEAEQFRKMFIGGLSSSTTDETLKEYYSQWGELVDCVVMRDPSTKRSRGFGFVSYKTQAEVDLAMANRPHMIDGKTVDPKRAVPRDQSVRSEANVSSKRLYVSGVREEHTEQMFEEYFSKFGTVLKVEIINDKTTGKPRGFAFVSFEDYDPVDKCVLQRSHQILNYRCDVKKALSKEEMSRERDRLERMGRSRGAMRGGPDRFGGPPGYGGNWGSGGGQWGGGGGRSQYYGGYGGSYGGGYGGGGPGGWNGPAGDSVNGGWNSAPQTGGWGSGSGGGDAGGSTWNQSGNQSSWGQGSGQPWNSSQGNQEWNGRSY
ncbi:unnamed protein product [Dracunculus medinensis]|uniref:Heterogeneous nuclear ribonucleoprotein A1 n=1 Tax=Dracunculus medinensis TaxID=318479 RepID=A0A0N4UNN9_DRAME|nr:unnamed protein product [Dracunculus medinensis]